MDNNLHTRRNTSINYRAGGLSEKDVSYIVNYSDDIRLLQLRNDTLALINNDEHAQEIQHNSLLIERMIEKGHQILNKEQPERVNLNPYIAMDTFAAWAPTSWTDMRVEAAHLPLLLRGLRIPHEINLPEKKGKVTGECALCILLVYLAYPNRLTDMQKYFQRHGTTIGVILKVVIHDLYHTHKHLVLDNFAFFAPRLGMYKEKILLSHAPNVQLDEGGIMANTVGFLDGSHFTCARPMGEHLPNPNPMYNGKTKTQSFNVLGVVFPDNMLMISPVVPGSIHDTTIYRKYMQESVEREFRAENAHGFNAMLYADRGFTRSQNVLPAHKLRQGQAVLTPWNEYHNSIMRKCRVTIEWIFADVESFHKYIGIPEQQRPMNGKLGMTFTVAALIHNCCTCLYGGKVAKKFDCRSPELCDYLNGHDVMGKTHEISYD